MLEKLDENEEFFAMDVNFFSNDAQWRVGRDSLLALARLNPDQDELTDVVIDALTSDTTVSIAFQFARKIPLPSPLKIIRTVLSANLETHVSDFRGVLLKMLRGTNAHRELILEFRG
jgi:hypothetical protein